MKANSYQCDSCLDEFEIPCIIFTSDLPNSCPFSEVEKNTNWTLLVRGDDQ